MIESLTSRLVVTILGAALAASAVACTGLTTNEGSTDTSKMALQKGKNGAPTGDGKTCSWPSTGSTEPGATSGSTGSGVAVSGTPVVVGGGCEAMDPAKCPPPPAPAPDPMPAPAPAPAPVIEHNVGDWFPSPDSCNQCTCTDVGIMCTMQACAAPPVPVPGPQPSPVPPPAPPPSKGCEVDGKLIAAGASIPSADGCNTCSCTAEGFLACTEMACPVPAPKE